MPPARLPLMETSENTATPSPAPAATARRSGRERRAPEKFQPEITVAPKRKRAADDEDGDDDAENHNPAAAAEGEGTDQEDEEMSDDLSDEEDEDSPDEEEQRAARRQKKKASNKKTTKANAASRSRKPASKKPKINGATPASGGVAQSINVVGLPSRPKPKKTARVITGDRRDGDGLYGMRSARASWRAVADAILQLPSLVRATLRMTSRASGTKSTRQTARLPSQIWSTVSC